MLQKTYQLFVLLDPPPLRGRLGSNPATSNDPLHAPHKAGVDVNIKTRYNQKAMDGFWIDTVRALRLFPYALEVRLQLMSNFDKPVIQSLWFGHTKGMT